MRRTLWCIPTALVLLCAACRGKGVPWSVTLIAGGGAFSLASPLLAARNIQAEVYTDSPASGRLRLSDLEGVTTTRSTFSDVLGPGTMTVMAGEDASGRGLRVTLRDYGRGFVAAGAEVQNLSTQPLTIEGFSFAVDGSSASRIVGAQNIGGVLLNGYQSWSPSVVSAVPDSPGTDETPFEDVENDGDLYLMDARTSWWSSALYTPGAALVAGALTASRWKTRVLAYRVNGILVWRTVMGHTWVQGRPARDRAVLPPGGTAASELVYFGIARDPRDGLEDYARCAAALTPPPDPPFAPVGWNSWNANFSAITEGTISDNARFIHDRFPGYGYNTVQVDDGWEMGWGEWVTDTAKFPSGMGGMALSVSALGFTPGIWMAPFLVGGGSPLVTAHPQWFLADDAGMPLTYQGYFIVDTTNPDALAWVLGNVRQILDWGYRYLKLDFLFAGAYEGRRYRAGATSLDAYREAMTAILRAAVASGAYVLACGAPVLPTAGLAHGIRTGGDIALAGVSYSWAFIKNEARNTAARYFLNALYAGDPDTALVRDVPLEEARVNLTAALLSGRIFALGDNLASLPPEKLALLTAIGGFPVFSRIRNGSGGPTSARPVDLFASPSAPQTSVAALSALPSSYAVPEVWALPLSGGGAVVGLFNWSEDAHEVGASLGDMGLGAGPFRAQELWSGRNLGTVSSSLMVPQAPHSVSLVWLRP